MSLGHQFILRLACRDSGGIVHAVPGLPHRAGCNMIDTQQFGDLHGEDATGRFFMRMHFRAHARGARMTGATPPCVTADLDEGPIIEQDAQHVHHTMPADDAAAGRDIGCMVPARAMHRHVERGVLAYGHACKVFR